MATNQARGAFRLSGGHGLEGEINDGGPEKGFSM